MIGFSRPCALASDLVKRFFPSFLPPFVAVFLGGTVLGTAVVGLRSGFAVAPVRYLGAVVGAAVFSACWTLAMAWMLRVQVGEEGIRSSDFWGFRRFLAWSRMREAKPFRVLGLGWIRVYPHDGSRPLWVPTFLARGDEFVAAVTAAAPGDNPLILQLRRSAD
jgi:hypothetical protein